MDEHRPEILVVPGITDFVKEVLSYGNTAGTVVDVNTTHAGFGIRGSNVRKIVVLDHGATGRGITTGIDRPHVIGFFADPVKMIVFDGMVIATKLYGLVVEVMEIAVFDGIAYPVHSYGWRVGLVDPVVAVKL